MERRAIDVLDRAVLRVDLEPPRQIRGLAEQFLVPPVAEAADALRDEERRSDAVGQACNGRARAMRDDRTDEAAEADPAPDSETALPDRDRSPPVVGELVPARHDVVEARADDPRRDAPDGDAEDEIPVPATPR